MLYILTFAALWMVAPLQGVSVCTKTTNEGIHYIIADSQAIIERQSGVGVRNLTQFGEVTTNLSLQYKSAELILTKEQTLKLILRNCSSPLTEAAQRLFPRAAEKIAEFLELTSIVTPEESTIIANLFELKINYANIKKVPFKIQFKFMDLLHIIQTHFPEVASRIAMPWSTRILYRMKWLWWF